MVTNCLCSGTRISQCLTIARRLKMLAVKQMVSSMVLFLFLLTSYTYAGTITVNSLADTDARGGDITLREAIMLSEGTLDFVTLSPEEQTQVAQPVGNGIADTINFGITGTIIARSDLPIITDDGTVIDASSQWIGEWPGGEPGVTLDGDWNGDGLQINGAANCHIRGLFITEFVIGIDINKGAKFNTIGGAGTGNRNVISGNGTYGISIFDSGTDNNVISGNYIGTDVAGTADLGNEEGVRIDDGPQWNTIGGTTVAERNIISGNYGWATVVIGGSGTDNNVMKGNYIGTDVTGTVALGNSEHGIGIVNGPQLNIIGGTTAGERNIISGNGGGGVMIYGASNNKVSGNYIGTDVTGTTSLGNGSGIKIHEGARSNTIGGTTEGERNIISGSYEWVGVGIAGSGTNGNAIEGNYIGTDVTGTMDLGNRYHGVWIGKAAQWNIIGRADAGNTIAFNGEDGVFIDIGGTYFNKVSGNSIHHNSGNGVRILYGPQSNIIGGVGAGNTISFNGGNGILIEGGGSDFNKISSNSIHDNNELGIELVWGGNDEIQPPNVLWSGLASGVLVISGAGAGSNATVEVFKADSSDEEGQIYLGSLIADGSGEFLGSMSVTGDEISLGDRIVTTTIHTDNNTSEFSSPSQVSVPPYDVAIFYDPDLPSANVPDALQFALLLVEELENKGLLAGIVNSEELAEYMRANPTGIMLICQGITPGTIFQNRGEEDLIYSWLRNGGIGGFVGNYPLFYWDSYENPTDNYGQENIFGVHFTEDMPMTVEPTELGRKYIPSLPDSWNTNLTVSLPILEDNLFLFESYADNGTNADPIAFRTEDMKGWFINFHTSSVVELPPYHQMAIEYAELISNRFASEELVIKMDQPSSDIIVPHGVVVDISWTGSGRTASSVSLGIDDDNIWNNGSVEAWLAVDQPVGGSYSWNTSDMPAGDYYVIAVVTDGENEAYSVTRIGVGVRVLSISSIDAAPGASAMAELRIDDASGMASGDIVMKYDASVITVDAVSAADLLSGMLLMSNLNTPGEIRLNMAGATGIPSGSGALVEINLTVSPDAEIGTETVLDFGDARIDDELGMMIPVRLENGAVRVVQPGMKGDVNSDGAVRSNDATMALRIAAQLMIPTEYQHWAADMDDDGQVRANDATLILRVAAGLAAPGMVTWGQGDMEMGRHITVALRESYGVAGGRVGVPIRVDDADMLASGEICIAYDSTVLRAVDVLSESGALLVSNATEPGILRIVFASANRLNSQTIAEIQFDVLADTASLLKFRTVDLYGPDARLVNSKGIDKEFRPRAMTPKRNSLLQNFPNPFNPETWIPYQLAEDSEVTVRIYSVTAQLIRAIDLGYREAGSYVTRDTAAYWDGRNEVGEQVSSGMYFCTIQAGEFTATKKMIVAR